MSSEYKGQCACGAIKYTCNAEPGFTLICQCRQCQRITGTGHAAQFVVEADSTTIEGEVSLHSLTSDAGSDIKSAFCGHCDSPMYKTTSMSPDKLFFHAATLEDPSIFKPQMVVYPQGAQPWDHVDPSLERKG